MSERILEAREVTTGYGDIRVVRDVSVSVTQGRVTAVLGRNGAGKTSLLRAIAGLNRVSAGSVLLDGAPIDALPPYRRVGRGVAFVQEGKRIFRRRTVEENLLLGGYSLRLTRRRADDRLARAYDRFPILGERRHERAAVLSGGQQQMLAVAQALVADPAFILLDEPSAGLAPAIVGDVMTTVDTLRRDGLGVLLVEQSVDFALRLADTVVVLDLGRTALTGRVGDERLRTRIENAYFGQVDVAG